MTMLRNFDPELDGWIFSNWREENISIHPGNIFPWELFRETYLGVHETNNVALAPLDVAFYAIFKSCAAQGNCGGLSLLALALYKYGGYMGFCGPASLHPGVNSPDDPDLHRAMNILQARQFSAHGIENFVEVSEAHNLNNAHAAYERVKENLGKGDFCVLSIANNLVGEYAHTVIPYKVEQHGAIRTLHIWDSNFPYDDFSDRYGPGPAGDARELTIRSAFDWDYQGEELYEGAGGGWCFTVPMSKVLTKARHPFALDMAFDQVMTLFVSGPGSAVAQISDETGRQFYRDDRDDHVSRLEIETDPDRRIPGLVRWPWYATNANGAPPGELYFLRRPIGSRDLNFIISGSNYQLLAYQAGNLIECQVEAKEKGRDRLAIQRLATPAQTIAIQSEIEGKQSHLRQLKVWRKQDEWRDVTIRDLEIGAEPTEIRSIGDLQAMEVSCPDRRLEFSMDVKQRINDVKIERAAEHLSSAPGTGLRVEPRNWNDLKNTKLDRSSFLCKAKEEE